jgi:ABC-type lipoprotein export system ATPase subunit
VHALKQKARLDLQRRSIGFVFQAYHLLDDLTVYENLDLPLSYRNVKASERKSVVCDTLDRFQIVGKKDLYPSQLSGGQQQLVAVARAIVASPKVILADEPTGNLHSDQAREIMELFAKLNGEGFTIVQVTHSDGELGTPDRQGLPGGSARLPGLRRPTEDHRLPPRSGGHPADPRPSRPGPARGRTPPTRSALRARG